MIRILRESRMVRGELLPVAECADWLDALTVCRYHRLARNWHVAHDDGGDIVLTFMETKPLTEERVLNGQRSTIH